MGRQQTAPGSRSQSGLQIRPIPFQGRLSLRVLQLVHQRSQQALQILAGAVTLWLALPLFRSLLELVRDVLSGG